MLNPVWPNTEKRTPGSRMETMKKGISSGATGAPPTHKHPTRTPKLPDPTAQAAKTGDDKKQPFRMFYDGISDAEYAASRRLRGAR